MEKNIADSPGPSTYSPSYKKYVLFILTGVYAFNFIDRQILVILQEPIKSDLGLNDTQLGLLTGFAFAVLYAILGLPIARYADKNNRKNIVSISLVVWSTMTALSGLAQNFFQLLLARIGVGVGEAGGSPPSHSIISDYYEPEKRATALSIYSTGVYIGIFLGFLIGGIIAKQFGWRVALYSLGLPGILYAILVWTTIKEPVKGQMDADTEAKEFKLSEVIKALLRKKSFVFIAFATGFQAFGSYGIGNFAPSFLIRSHGMDVQTAGIALAIIAVLGGGLGTFMGGYFTDRRLRHRDIRWYCWLPAIAGPIALLLSIYVFYGSNLQAVLVIFTFTYFFSALYLGPAIAVTHSLVPAKMRAFASGVLFFVLNIIGLGFGPLVIGMLSDWLEPTYGQESLRYAFAIIFVTGTIAAILFYMASRYYKEDLEAS